MMGIFNQLFGQDKRGMNLTREQKQGLEALVNELISIGLKEDYLSERPGGAYNGQCHHRRTREIGEKLNALGGLDVMSLAFKRVKKKVGRQLGDHLEYAWAGIGEWMG